MDIRWKKGILVLACALLAVGAAPAPEAEEVSEPVEFLSYEEALTYFDFDRAASNWCVNFGLDPAERLEEARAAILAGTDPALIVGLATFARDTGHGDEKLVVSNAFRPACYQEVIGLHDGNANTGPFRDAMSWNGRSVTKFWWSAETAEGWPHAYALELSRYDLDTLDLRYFYRAALRLWDNGWVNGYYARPGCSAHNSGAAMDIQNYWLGANFATSYTYQGREYAMADYGLYKPLQPSAVSAGETWHITSSPEVLALGNYDGALDAGYEIVYALYYNPTCRGWEMQDGRGVYLGAGVTVLQLRLCQLGLLEREYVTGFFCTRTDAAVRAFQAAQGLEADGICGSGTMELLLPQTQPEPDGVPPVLTEAAVDAAGSRGFTLRVRGEDETRLNAFRVETLGPESDNWVRRYYNPPASGVGELDVDIWEEGEYRVRVCALDAAGNESELREVGSVYVDATPPRLLELCLFEIGETGFSLRCRGEDDHRLLGFRVELTDENGARREHFLLSDGAGDVPWTAEGLEEGRWSVTVTAVDAAGNETGHTLRWRYEAGRALPGQSVTYYGPAEAGS